MRKYNHEIGTFITGINDLEGLVHDSVYYDFKEVIDKNNQSAKEEYDEMKAEMEYYERLADERLQQLISGTNLVDYITHHIRNSKRMNREKILCMLEELKNQLNNW